MAVELLNKLITLKGITPTKVHFVSNKWKKRRKVCNNRSHGLTNKLIAVQLKLDHRSFKRYPM